jgi:long-subunit acyl-CoA synthetase (AMP-forming)
MSSFVAIEHELTTLSNGKLINASELKSEIGKICHYVQHVVLARKDEKHLTAIIFPKIGLLKSPDYERTPEEGCFCPRNLNELGKCLSGCLQTLNSKLKPGYSKIDAAVIINTELSIEEGTLTSLFVAIGANVVKKYDSHLNDLYGKKALATAEAYPIILNL